MKCLKCGAELPEGSRFCSQCGTPLTSVSEITTMIPAVSEELTARVDLDPASLLAVEELAEGVALLIVQRGSGVGARYLLDADVTSAGRHPDSDIFLDDITVSRHHARFVRRDGVTSVEDLGSLNGTYVNRTLVDGAATLRVGDEVQIGKFRLTFFHGERGLN